MADVAVIGKYGDARSKGALRALQGWTVLGILGLLALVGWLLLFPRPSSVSFEGRSVDQWLNGGFVDASRALYELGPEAVPDIFKKLLREHPRYGYWQRYRSVWQKVPAPCRHALPRPKTVSFDEWRACNALVVIGPRTIPRLTIGLKHRRALVRSTSAQALSVLAQRGSDLASARPALEKALQDASPEVRRYAAQALAGRG